MISKITTIIPFGFSGETIDVEGSLTHGLPSFNIVGLANKTVYESRERVRSALKSSGFTFPAERLSINLAPADLAKRGPHLDLPIALSVMILSGELRQEDLGDAIFTGELGLDGSLKPVRGIINIVEKAKTLGYKTVFLPTANLSQASLVKNIDLIGIKSLQELFLVLKRQTTRPKAKTAPQTILTPKNGPTLDYISGQDQAKRALEIAIAGHHNLLLFGPPGTGKTLLAKVAPSLLPPLSQSEQVTLTKIYSLFSNSQQIVAERPFRSPHHTASIASIIGGGANGLPGEISLAHLGVLFLDELPEFPRNVLEALRQPLEDHEISISRTSYKITYPAKFMLIASMNPCPCGFLGDPVKTCTCTPSQIQRYQKKISGPLLDRIDLFLNLSRPDRNLLLDRPKTSLQNVVKNNITEVFECQKRRFGVSGMFNSYMNNKFIREKVVLLPETKTFLDSAADRLNLSPRSYFKIIKVARTIADLDHSENISLNHITEALSYRQTFNT